MPQEMKTLIEKLDPEENGRISFDGFCKGIHDFLGKWFHWRHAIQSPADIHVCSGLSEVSVILRYAQFY